MLKRRRTTYVTSSQSLTQPNIQTPEEPQVMRRSHHCTRSQTKSQSDSHTEQISGELHHSAEHLSQTQGPVIPSEELCDGEHDQEAPQLLLSLTDLENTPQCIDQVRSLGDTSTISITDLSGESKGGTRGFTRLKRVWNLPEGYKVGVQFNSSFRPVRREGGLLMRFLGTCVRRPDLVPINIKTWLKVPSTHKEELWDLIKSKFEIPIAHENEIKKVLIQKAGYMWRGFKSNLKSHYFVEDKSVEEIIANVPPRVDPEQWASLVALWNTSDMKTLSENNKALRKLQKIRHTCGAKSFAEVAEEMKEKDGVEPSEEELYLLTHKRKDGTALNEDTAKRIAEIEKRMAQRQNNPQISDDDIEGQYDANDDGDDDDDDDSDYDGTPSKVMEESNKDKRGKEVVNGFSTPSTSNLSPIDAIAAMVSEYNMRHVDEERIAAHDDRSQAVEKRKRVEEEKRKSLGSVPSRKTPRSPLIVASARVVLEKETRQADEEKIRTYEEGRKQLEEKKRVEEERRKVEEERKRVEEEKKKVEEERKRVEEEKKKVEEERKRVEEERRLAREDRRKAEEERDKSEAEIKFLKDRLTWMETLVSRILPSPDSTAPPKEVPNGRSDPSNRMRMNSETSSHA